MAATTSEAVMLAAGASASASANKEEMWDRAETRTYFFIPGLFRVIGVTLHCYLGAALCFVDVGIRMAIQFIRNFILSLVSEQRETATTKKFDPVSNAVGGFMAWYTQWLYNPISDCWNRPIVGPAAKQIDVVAREWKDEYGMRVLKVIPGGPVRRCVNMGSYNYLGFGGPNEFTSPPVLESLRRSGVMVATTPCEMGVSHEQRELERAIAAFLGKEDAVVVPMGFATNSMVLPALTGPRCLVLSDNLNHASIITGLRASGSTLRRCGHNDPRSLERELQIAVKETPRWRRILVVLEGLYSMEGEICPLPTMVRLCKRYGALLYVDEAHSIGALGPHGRGVCDYYGIDPRDVDILMGTFTKSFGSVGGYVAASHKIVAMLRRTALASIYGVSMAPACAQQALSALAELYMPRGKARIAQLHENSTLVRKRLADAGLMLLGQHDSPVVPIMVMHPWKLTTFSRECLRRGVAVVSVGYPAVPMLGLRARLCVSAGFDTREVEESVAVMIDVARQIGIDYFSRSTAPERHEITDDVLANGSATAACEFKSEPIVPDDAPEPREVRVIDMGKQLQQMIVLSGHDYLGLGNSAVAIERSAKTLEAYGCGSCGPRGFYGTTDKHLELEARLAGWLGTEAAIVYSYGALAATSAIPPYASEPTDVVFYDEKLCHAARFGVRISKGRAFPFPHNNIRALAQLIKSVDAGISDPAKRKGRRIIVTEGVFAGSGDVLSLPELVELKKKFGYLLIVDETQSLGALGSTGRGVREHWADITGDTSLLAGDAIDIIIGSLEPALGSVGGFCVGTRKLIQHQVLSAIGYVFSASMPPYLCTAAVTAIDALEGTADIPSTALQRCAALHADAANIRRLLQTDDAAQFFDISNTDDNSPLVFASLRQRWATAKDEEALLEAVEDACWKEGVAVCVARFAPEDEGRPARPSLRICASAKHTLENTEAAIATIVRAVRNVLAL